MAPRLIKGRYAPRWRRQKGAISFGIAVLLGGLWSAPALAERAPTGGKQRVATAAATRTAPPVAAVPDQPKDEAPSTRGSAKHPSSEARSEPPVCLVRPTTVIRDGAEHSWGLVDCDGDPAAGSRDRLSVMARLRGSTEPVMMEGKIIPTPEIRRDGEISRGIKLVDPGLLFRLQRIADRFEGKAITIVSGYRPQSDGSLHQHAKALDIHVSGIDNRDLVAFCRTLDDTGCGYYPNSSFVHVDVRPPKTGVVFWVDVSGPGEPAKYVRDWPSMELTPLSAEENRARAEGAKQVAAATRAKSKSDAKADGAGSGAKRSRSQRIAKRKPR